MKRNTQKFQPVSHHVKSNKSRRGLLGPNLGGGINADLEDEIFSGGIILDIPNRQLR